MHSDAVEMTRRIEMESGFVDLIYKELSKVIVGQRYMIDRLLIGLLADGHLLLEGVPGLAKTTAVKALSSVIKTGFSRIQFTPDLLPADLIGTMVYNQKEGNFTTQKGPIFSNIILADEINRSPAKVQSALLEAMQERQVTIAGTSYGLDKPFLVLATQNPLEQEGTYPLPEAQIDRFMLKLHIGYPEREEEREIIRRMTSRELPSVEPVVEVEQILRSRELMHDIIVESKIEDYVLDLVFATREPAKYRLEELEDLISWGASPRAGIFLIQAARAHAFLKKRGYVVPDDIKIVAHDILRHRIGVTFEAEAEEVTTDEIVTRILNRVEVP